MTYSTLSLILTFFLGGCFALALSFSYYKRWVKALEFGFITVILIAALLITNF